MKKRLIILTMLTVFLFSFLSTSETFAKRKVKKENNKLNTEKSNVEKINKKLRAGLITFESGSQWEGTYTANEKERSLTFTVNEETVNFLFGPTKEYPNLPNGEFIMLPDYNKETGAIKLEGVKWIDKPLNYVMVDLVGSVSGDYINGVVLDENGRTVSGQFSVKRVK